MNDTVKLLSTEQTQAFDTEYVDDEMFELVAKQLQHYHITQQDFQLMDVGGGNGKYVDRILSRFPQASVTLVEPEPSLVAKNTPNTRKHIIPSTFQNLDLPSQLQVVQFNWVLHHFVTDGYANTCQLQQKAIEEAYQILAPGGVILIYENFYEGAWLKSLPSWMIYQLTASQRFAPFAERLGANTAGVGVCFHSASYWQTLLQRAGFLTIQETHCYDFGTLSPLKKLGLMLKKQSVGLLIAQKPHC
ncbi:class I SAM-dependent methyltransferase [Vibrio renipiscarius]|uniref:Methyltransferase n=1 Tax=Vibrio renipiscarius TaxID=1461322 RepID=A0A0C2JJ26_9VIBR|nr:class I SAM-dependent methyltransferase [Vibrio renipiscarius]KII76484.1 methyltransferase [Vibrio renipiscarius]KII77994.1 methyltransferase [Vibrio renipiscarius]